MASVVVTMENDHMQQQQQHLSAGAAAAAVAAAGSDPNDDPPQNMSDNDEDDHDDDDCETNGKKKGKGGGKEGKSRRELPAGAVATLKQWLLSPEHFTHPYPTPQDQVMLMQKTGIDKKQLKNWFTNARRRIWKPMLKKQLEQGKLAATSTGGRNVTLVSTGSVVGGVPGLVQINPPGVGDGTHSQAPQAAATFAVYDASGTMQAAQQAGTSQGTNAAQSPAPGTVFTSGPMQTAPGTWAYVNQQQYQQQQQQQQASMATSNSIGSLPPISAPAPTGGMPQGAPNNVQNNTGAPSSGPGMMKTDSHAVLMELFARDQDLVRQASEGAKLKAAAAAAQAAAAQHQHQQNAVAGQPHPGQHPMKMAQQAAAAVATQNQSQMAGKGPAVGAPGGGPCGALMSGSAPSSGQPAFGVPTLNSWPHFSSVSSLNNLGSLTGVKSITNLSGADLASQGNLNRKGNLAHVKSHESMGRADSYAFLEIFFDNSGSVGDRLMNRGTKREREEDNDVGLSLDADESPLTNSSPMKSGPEVVSSATRPAPLPSQDSGMSATSGLSVEDNAEELKRNYDDALAARGLISVSRSSEKLTDLVLPAKMQRTLSQEFIRQQQMSQSSSSGQFGSHGFTNGHAQMPGSSTSGFPMQQNQPQAQPQPQQPHGDNGQQPHYQHPGQQHLQEQAQGHAQDQQQDQGSTSGNSQHSSGHAQQHPSIAMQQTAYGSSPGSSPAAPMSDPSITNSSVNVPSSTKCSICNCTNVDTQLRPCGHMFHGRCLKPSLQSAMGPPRCPIDHIAMQSAVLAVPTDSNEPTQPQQSSPGAGGVGAGGHGASNG